MCNERQHAAENVKLRHENALMKSKILTATSRIDGLIDDQYALMRKIEKLQNDKKENKKTDQINELQSILKKKNSELTRRTMAKEKMAEKCERAISENCSLYSLIASIRKAAGDPEGKLMQDELIKHIENLANRKQSSGYDAWRITFQSPDHAAIAAFDMMMEARRKAAHLESMIDRGIA